MLFSLEALWYLICVGGHVSRGSQHATCDALIPENYQQ